MYDISEGEQDYNLLRKLSYTSFRVMQSCNEKILGIFYRDQFLLRKFFSLINNNQSEKITSRGYFQELFKSFLGEMNPQCQIFIKILKKQAEEFIFPLLQNLNQHNTEIIKEILISYDSSLEKIQNCCFEYLLFFYLNEQNKDNLNGKAYTNFSYIFKELKENNKVYKYKEKYIKPLYFDSFIKDKQNLEGILLMKLNILVYLGATQQINSFEFANELFKSVANLRGGKKYRNLLLLQFQFLETISEKAQNKESFSEEILDTLIRVLKENIDSDFIQNSFYQIICNLAKEII